MQQEGKLWCRSRSSMFPTDSEPIILEAQCQGKADKVPRFQPQHSLALPHTPIFARFLTELGLQSELTIRLDLTFYQHRPTSPSTTDHNTTLAPAVKMSSRPTVGILGADGSSSGETHPLPAVFSAPIRPDIVQYVEKEFCPMQRNNRD